MFTGHKKNRAARAAIGLVLGLSFGFGPITVQIATAQVAMPPVPSLAPMLSKVTPGVVGISIAPQAGQASQNPLLSDPFFKKFFEESAKRKGQRAEPSVEVRPAGSGVIIDAIQGLVLTNHHVVREAGRVVVVLKDRRELPARVLGSDAGTDIALLKVEAESLVAVPLGNADATQVGDFVVAIGNPFGIGQTVTSGIVSAVGRGGISPEGFEDYIQTDAAINPGNSGGALVNLRGELVGINTAILTGGQGNRGNIGIGFAVPVNMAQEVAAQIKRFGEVRRGRIGVQSVDVTPALAASKNLTVHEGALISAVESGSPAEKVGVRADDVVVQLNGRSIRSAADLRNRLALVPVGTVADLVVQRGGSDLRLAVTVEAVQSARPQTEGRVAPDSAADPAWGLQLAPAPGGGVLVARTDPKGKAHAAGLRAGDQILAVNRQPVAAPADLAQLLSLPGEKIISVLRGSTKLRFTAR